MADCIFCKKDTGLLCENELAKVFYDGYPVNEGHVLVVPKRHVETFFEATAEELAAINEMIFRAKDLLEERYRPDGYNIGVNVKHAGGQSVFHLHVHVIPRYLGDVENPRGGIRRIKKSIVSYPLEDLEEEGVCYKLVRDLIPEIIRQAGQVPVTRVAGDEEYLKMLNRKLWEEVREFAETGKTEELADILEVVKALAESRGLGMEDVLALAEKKAKERGAFKNRIILERVLENKQAE